MTQWPVRNPTSAHVKKSIILYISLDFFFLGGNGKYGTHDGEAFLSRDGREKSYNSLEKKILLFLGWDLWERRELGRLWSFSRILRDSAKRVMEGLINQVMHSTVRPPKISLVVVVVGEIQSEQGDLSLSSYFFFCRYFVSVKISYLQPYKGTSIWISILNFFLTFFK